MNRDLIYNFLSLNAPNIRHFSLARHALIEALRLAHVGKGDVVLLPEFLCRELLASIAATGASIEWYAIGPDLSPVAPSTAWPNAKAVLAVNYFGFPQNLKPFEDYAARCGALIIEDNAHGFLSYDEFSRLLGSRGKLGIFSLRKTIRMPDGASLLINDPAYLENLRPQLPIVGRGFNRSEAIKSKLNSIPLIGPSLAANAINLVRFIRLFLYGAIAKPADELSERELPYVATPWFDLIKVLSSLDVDAEINRRRNAYSKMAAYAARNNIEPVFPELPRSCVPYGFPFRESAGNLDKMTKYAASQGFGIMSWPDLPGEVEPRAPSHYQNVRLVNFLW